MLFCVLSCELRLKYKVNGNEELNFESSLIKSNDIIKTNNFC